MSDEPCRLSNDGLLWEVVCGSTTAAKAAEQAWAARYMAPMPPEEAQRVRFELERALCAAQELENRAKANSR
jgi:hypothetical protein